MGLNKSAIAREFWRKIYNENAIDLRNSDARKSVVNDFLNDPMNIKEGWSKTTDKRFFRLAFDKVTREFGKSTSQFGVKPEPKRVRSLLENHLKEKRDLINIIHRILKPISEELNSEAS